MDKEVKELLGEKASRFQMEVLRVLVEKNVPFNERNSVIGKLQSALSEFLEPAEGEPLIGFTYSSFKAIGKNKQGDEKKAMVEKLRKIVNKHNLSYAQAATKLGISSGPLYNWLNGKTLPSRTSLNKLKEAIKKLNNELCAKEKETENQVEKDDISF
jgi:DNA-binding transcriptional regulator YiaG